ncbi:MAG: AbrB/MazE/SpoVT family DNA-binding domain-containing protein [Nitrosopumilus sp.]
MRLQKRFNRKVGGKEYSKWILTIPPDIIDELKWTEGDELDISIRKGKLTVMQIT